MPERERLRLSRLLQSALLRVAEAREIAHIRERMEMLSSASFEGIFVHVDNSSSSPSRWRPVRLRVRTVRRHYLHGVPCEEAVKLAPTEVPNLVRMLGDPNERTWWPNVVVVLGYTASASAADGAR